MRVSGLENEDQVYAHQNSHYSGVLHSGIYYQPGSLKARLAAAGIRQMLSFLAPGGAGVRAPATSPCGNLVWISAR